MEKKIEQLQNLNKQIIERLNSANSEKESLKSTITSVTEKYETALQQQIEQHKQDLVIWKEEVVKESEILQKDYELKFKKLEVEHTEKDRELLEK